MFSLAVQTMLAQLINLLTTASISVALAPEEARHNKYALNLLLLHAKSNETLKGKEIPCMFSCYPFHDILHFLKPVFDSIACLSQ
jgi:hypothetical protein